MLPAVIKLFGGTMVWTERIGNVNFPPACMFDATTDNRALLA